MKPGARNGLIALAVAVLLAGAAWLWWQRPPPASETVSAAVAEAASPASTAASSAGPEALPRAAAEPPPLAASVVEPSGEAPALTRDSIADALVKLVGRQAVLSLLQTDDFPRRFVATVDNLGRSQAPSMVWPVRPTEGRFSVIEQEGRSVISPDNALRYAPLVLLAETLDIGQAADLYVRLLPLLQQAYEEIGFPHQRFHARLLEVIDQLLATPDVPDPIAVQLTEVKGPIPSERPWVRYEFSDAGLQSASAGQKILLRIGAVDRRRLQARLEEFRQALASRNNTR